MLPVSPTKGPVCQHGVYSGSTDPDEIRRMWAREPGANPAVRCEAFGVLDVDPRNGGHVTINGWGERFGDFPRTWEAETGSGGTHLYFRHAPELEGMPLGKIAEGVDFKGNGKHYVLVPPSRSKSGVYRWRVRPSECELATAPRWLIDLILEAKRLPEPTPIADASHVSTDERLERATRYARAIPPAVSGQGGHSQTFVAAVRIARGFALSEEEAFHVLSIWNQTCLPPWSAKDLRRKIREALRCGTMTVGALLERGRAA
jgi:hypothetical protein